MRREKMLPTWFALIFILSACSQKLSVLKSKSTIELMQGQWVCEQDSFWNVEIQSNKWIDYYSGSIVDSSDISITSQLPEGYSHKIKAEFILLKTVDITLNYELLGFTENSMSMMHTASGKINLFLRAKF